MNTLFAGLDIGGQSIKGIVLDAEGRLEGEASLPTPTSGGAEAVLKVIQEVLERLKGRGRLAAVGVGTPGGVDENGVIVGMSANIDGWFGTPLGSRISAMAEAPCGVRNDGNLAAYAEWAVRADRAKALLFIGLGTGIGGGYVSQGRILGGCDDRALEIGHFIIEPHGRHCVCGIDGCSEAYASGPSIGRIASELAKGSVAGVESLLREAGFGAIAESGFGGEYFAESRLAARARAGEILNAHDVYEAFASGDTLAVVTDAVTIAALSRTAGTALALLAPDIVVLGGGVIQGAPHLPRRISEEIFRYIYSDGWRNCRFEAAALSHKAGLLGAALYAVSLVWGDKSVPPLARKARAAF